MLKLKPLSLRLEALMLYEQYPKKATKRLFSGRIIQRIFLQTPAADSILYTDASNKSWRASSTDHVINERWSELTNIYT